jgi:CarboxypepD_reg-like domain/TonB-dependent Receptor Plug Domain
MTMKKINLIGLVLLIAPVATTKNTQAQTAEIRGVVKDKSSGELLPGVSVAYYLNGTLNGTSTDENGFYKIKPVEPGTYLLRFSFVGFDALVIENILVRFGELVTVNGNLSLNNNLPIVEIEGYRTPLIPRGGITQISTIEGEDLQHSIVKDVRAIASKATGAYTADDNDPIFIRGSRSSSTKYIVDGVPVSGDDFDVPGTAIEQVSVITGGIPAMFGDATGGIIVVTTKGYKMR